jgi:hypothetical protein
MRAPREKVVTVRFPTAGAAVQTLLALRFLRVVMHQDNVALFEGYAPADREGAFEDATAAAKCVSAALGVVFDPEVSL